MARRNKNKKKAITNPVIARLIKAPIKTKSYKTPSPTTLRFSPYAWAKLKWFCVRGPHEVGGFGVTDKDDMFLVRDFVTVDQEVDWASVDLSDDTGYSISDLTDDMCDKGYHPRQFLSLWMHTHPGSSPSPSHQDEETFKETFSHSKHSMMFILAEEGDTYCRLQIPDMCYTALLKVEVDFEQEFEAANHATWEKEYTQNIHHTPPASYPYSNQGYNPHRGPLNNKSYQPHKVYGVLQAPPDLGTIDNPNDDEDEYLRKLQEGVYVEEEEDEWIDLMDPIGGRHD